MHRKSFNDLFISERKGIIMGRVARQKSETGIYHVMMRGIDKRNIFLDEEEYSAFLKYLKRAQERTGCTIYAFCLMTNHVHLLLKTEGMIGDVIKRVAVGYAQYHNIKNGRTGHLFQNRFKSEVVETNEYFLTVLRYIHQNPIKAGLVQEMKHYKWSSYQEYLYENKIIVDIEFAFSFFKNLKEFLVFMEEKNEDKCLDYNPIVRWTDDDLMKYIQQLVNIDEVYNLDKQARDKVLKKIKIKTGASNRQLSRVLGFGRGIFEKLR